jgi:predicted PhzF superfamily epimerase YddE/YHI9
LRFATRSGELTVQRNGDMLKMDFPALPSEPCEAAEDLLMGLGTPPAAVFGAIDYMVVYEHEDEVRALRPDMQRLIRLDRRGVILTAPGSASDYEN